MGRGNIAVAKIGGDGAAVQFSVKPRMTTQRSDLRGEEKALIVPAIVERLDAKMVTNQMEGAFSAIPKGKREDSYEPLYRILQEALKIVEKQDFTADASETS